MTHVAPRPETGYARPLRLWMALPISDEHSTVQVGETIELPTQEIDVENNSTFINVFTSATETLLNLEPWRLLEVAPIGATVQISFPGHPYRFGVRALRVLREAPAWQALGPQGKTVLDLVMQAYDITAWQAGELAAHWQLPGRTVWDSADREHILAVVDAGRVPACHAAETSAVNAVRRAAGGHLRKHSLEAACAAVRAAVIAEVVRDHLSDEAARVLQQPWVRVFGSPRRAEHPA
ncbi:hypothetical protein ACWD0J_21135 [Streptomyces sp. NPDC003011]